MTPADHAFPRPVSCAVRLCLSIPAGLAFRHHRDWIGAVIDGGYMTNLLLIQFIESKYAQRSISISRKAAW